jgi:N utilization substance protein B
VSPRPASAGPDRAASGHRRRRHARRMAIEILYEADVLGRKPTEVVAEWRAAGKVVPDYAEELVAGVEREADTLDGMLAAHSEGWPIHRMAVVDRNILRVACYEVGAGVPVAVAVNEAVELANELSTEDSGRFVNGVLGRIARTGED